MGRDEKSIDGGRHMKRSLRSIYAAEPDLRLVAEKAIKRKRQGMSARIAAYENAKREAWFLVGWGARNPRLRSSDAWDCFFRQIIRGLRI